MSKTSLIGFSLLLNLLLATPGIAQRAAAKWPRVLRDDVQPRWSADGQWLHYSVTVDQTGTRQQFQVNLASGERTEVARQELTAPVHLQQTLTRSHRSGISNQDITVTIVNQLSEPLVCWWLSSDGTAAKYQTLAPGQRLPQHTFADHVWSLRSEQGRELVRFQALPSDWTMVIDSAVVEAYTRLATTAEADARDTTTRGQRVRQGRTDPRGSAHLPSNTDQLLASRPQVELRDHNVWIAAQKSDQWAQLTHDGCDSDRYRGPLLISPSGRYLAVIQTKVATKREIHIVESSPADQLQPKLHSFAYVKPGDPIDKPRLRLFDLETKKSIAVSDQWFENPWSVTQLRWLAGPERCVCLVNERGHQRLRLLAFDPAAGTVQTLVEEVSHTFIDYSNKVQIDWLDADGSFLWMSERSGFNHLLRISAQDGTLINELTSGQWVVRKVEHVDLQRQQVWFVASGIIPGQDPYYRHLCRVNLDGTDLRVMSAGNGDHECEFSPDRRWFIDRYSRVDLPTVAVLRDATSGQQVCELARADWSDLLASGWSVPERFVAPGRDGVTDIYGVIIRPQRRLPGKTYPVLEKIYAGPHAAHVPKAFSLLRQEHDLADLGMVVVCIDGMGTSHRGKQFHDVCWKNLADAGFPDRIAWIKAAAQRYSELDVSRVGIFGGSAGGQNALRALIDHHHFYRVAVADCGCHDNRMDKIWWNEAWMGWPVDAAYARNSNVTQAAAMQGALMLIVGELDHNVDPASTMQVVDALVKADKDFELVVIPGAGHGAAETPYGSRRRREFLVEHLVHAEDLIGPVQQELQQPQLE